jgi:hypothetical protein
MGSYSWTDYCSIRIRPGMRIAFLQWIEDLKKETKPDWIEFGKEHAKVISVDPVTDEVEISIDSWKLISYWYNHSLEYFDTLSKYVEGYMELSFETPNEHAIIRFEDNGTIYELGQMQYIEYTSKDLRKNKGENI